MPHSKGGIMMLIRASRRRSRLGPRYDYAENAAFVLRCASVTS
jgi:hypothetical protein